IGKFNGFVADPDGPIISGTLGVARFDGRTFQVIPRARVPSLSEVDSVVETPGDIWFISSRGVARVARRELLNAFANPIARPRPQVFNAQDGFGGADGAAGFDVTAARAPDGRLWFFTVDGLSWIEPNHLYRNRLPPPVIIRSLTAGGRVYAAPANLKLTKG